MTDPAEHFEKWATEFYQDLNGARNGGGGENWVPASELMTMFQYEGHALVTQWAHRLFMEDIKYEAKLAK